MLLICYAVLLLFVFAMLSMQKKRYSIQYPSVASSLLQYCLMMYIRIGQQQQPHSSWSSAATVHSEYYSHN